MRSNKLTIQINKSPAEIFKFYINPKNTHLWVESIIDEQTNEWPIKTGTVYSNQNKAGIWSEYRVTEVINNELFELISGDGNYHVRYSHKIINQKTSELEYYEWVDRVEIDGPFTQDILEKLKTILEDER